MCCDDGEKYSLGKEDPVDLKLLMCWRILTYTDTYMHIAGEREVSSCSEIFLAPEADSLLIKSLLLMRLWRHYRIKVSRNRWIHESIISTPATRW